MCNLSKGVEERGRAKGRAEGRKEGRAEGRAEGRKEGRAEGRAEGRREGIAENAVAFIKNLMVSTGMSLEQAMDALQVPEADRADYAEKLRRK